MTVGTPLTRDINQTDNPTRKPQNADYRGVQIAKPALLGMITYINYID